MPLDTVFTSQVLIFQNKLQGKQANRQQNQLDKSIETRYARSRSQSPQFELQREL